MIWDCVSIVDLIKVLNDEAADLVPYDHRDFLVLIVIPLQRMAIAALILDGLSDELRQHIDDLHIELPPE